jgi:error-prone DNA polymerase
LRARVSAAHIVACDALTSARNGARVHVAGVILVRQRPGSAAGVVFMTIEDETGVANAVIWPKVLERMRKVVMGARLVVVHGRVQRHEDIIHVVAERLEDRSDWLQLLTEDGEAMDAALANADEVRRPEPGSWRSSRESQELPLPLSAADHIKHPGGEDPRQKGERRHPRWHPRCHPRNERIIPKSRDFH